MHKDTVVVDLDGTLCDGRARYHLVQGKHRDYEEFHRRLLEDPPNSWCVRLVQALRRSDGVKIVLVSARPKSTLEDTTTWLRRHLGESAYDVLYLLREDGDSTPDEELKRAWLRAYGKERVLFTVDDRAKVVRMWREEGLTCLQCADWEGDKPKPTAHHRAAERIIERRRNRSASSASELRLVDKILDDEIKA